MEVHNLNSDLSMVKVVRPVNTLADLMCQKWSPYKSRKAVFVLKIAQPVPIKDLLQPAETAAMCTALHEYARLTSPILHVPFLLAQNLSLKQIAPTDNM